MQPRRTGPTGPRARRTRTDGAAAASASSRDPQRDEARVGGPDLGGRRARQGAGAELVTGADLGGERPLGDARWRERADDDLVATSTCLPQRTDRSVNGAAVGPEVDAARSHLGPPDLGADDRG